MTSHTRLRRSFTVILVCGHQVTCKNPPLNEKAAYICPANVGHGYSVNWASYVNHAGPFRKENSLYGGQ